MVPAAGIEPYPSSKPSELFVSYTPYPPIVESSFGALSDQPLRFYFQTNLTGQYQQLIFHLPATGCGRIFITFDMLVTQPPQPMRRPSRLRRVRVDGSRS